MKILVFYSGGKDSQACLIWAVKKYGVDMVEAVFCDTMWENPLTYLHIHETCEQIGVKLVRLVNEKYTGLVDLSEKKKRFPSTNARFCTSELKSIPAIDYILSHKCNLIVIQGIRRGESKSRSLMDEQCFYFKYYFQPYTTDKQGKPKYHTYRKKEVAEWCKNYNADTHRPIIDWTAQETLSYIITNGQTPNALYYQGFSRVGCFPCIMARHREVKLIIENHPEQWQRLKDAEQKIGRSFFPPDYIPKHACANRKYPMSEDVEKYIIGKNATLDMFEQDAPSCMSVYNLCE